MKGKPWQDKDGNWFVPFDDGSGDEVYIRSSNIEEMIVSTNGPNGLSEIIMNWKMQHPSGTKEEFIKESFFTRETVDKLW